MAPARKKSTFNTRIYPWHRFMRRFLNYYDHQQEIDAYIEQQLKWVEAWRHGR